MRCIVPYSIFYFYSQTSLFEFSATYNRMLEHRSWHRADFFFLEPLFPSTARDWECNDSVDLAKVT